MSTIVSSDQSSIFLLLFREVMYCVCITYSQGPCIILLRSLFDVMVKTKRTLKMGPVTRPVSTAAKRPDITSAYLDSIEEALDDFADGIISTSSEQKSTAYKNLVNNYKAALLTIWEKAEATDVDVILTSVADKKFVELEKMKKMLTPRAERSQVIREQREVPELANIFGALMTRLSGQQLPSKEICEIIGGVLSDLAAAHAVQTRAAKGISDLAGLVTPRTVYFNTRSSRTSYPALGITRGNQFSAHCTKTTAHQDRHCTRPKTDHQLLQIAHLAGSKASRTHAV